MLLVLGVFRCGGRCRCPGKHRDLVDRLARWRARTACNPPSGLGDRGIMPPRERRMWKDREVPRLKDARAEHRSSRNLVGRRLEPQSVQRLTGIVRDDLVDRRGTELIAALRA